MSRNEQCPYCGSDNIQGAAGFCYDGDIVVDSQECLECGRKFFALYKLYKFEDEEGMEVGKQKNKIIIGS